MTLKNLPKCERPRERLAFFGPEALSSVELIAICLGSGSVCGSVLSLAQEMLSHFKSIDKLFQATLEELMAFKGIGYAKAIKMQAIFTLTKRFPKPAGDPKYPVSCARDIFIFAQHHFQNIKKEMLLIMLRDTKGFIYYHKLIAIGTLSEVLIHPREVFNPAITHRAHSFILAHNHPSGDPSPSKRDYEITALLIKTSRLVGIAMDDHLVIGKVGYTSFLEKGFFKRKKY